MHVLYLARLVLVQLASKFKLCRFLYTKNADIVCMFCFQILYVWLQYSIMYLQHLLLCFFNRRTDSGGSDIFFLILNKIECIVGELFKKLVRRSYLSLGTFLNRFPLQMIRRENSAFPYFTLFPVNFLKDDQRAEEGKILNYTHTPRKNSEKGTGK